MPEQRLNFLTFDRSARVSWSIPDQHFQIANCNPKNFWSKSG